MDLGGQDRQVDRRHAFGGGGQGQGHHGPVNESIEDGETHGNIWKIHQNPLDPGVWFSTIFEVRAAQTGVEKARPFSDELLSMIKGLVKKLKGDLAG